ncbi:MAG: hypothetical protein QM756_05465 [Polyangiaceae bacterium]
MQPVQFCRKRTISEISAFLAAHPDAIAEAFAARSGKWMAGVSPAPMAAMVSFYAKLMKK